MNTTIVLALDGATSPASTAGRGGTAMRWRPPHTQVCVACLATYDNCPCPDTIRHPARLADRAHQASAVTV